MLAITRLGFRMVYQLGQEGASETGNSLPFKAVTTLATGKGVWYDDGKKAPGAATHVPEISSASIDLKSKTMCHISSRSSWVFTIIYERGKTMLYNWDSCI